MILSSPPLLALTFPNAPCPAFFNNAFTMPLQELAVAIEGAVARVAKADGGSSMHLLRHRFSEETLLALGKICSALESRHHTYSLQRHCTSCAFVLLFILLGFSLFSRPPQPRLVI